jgi:hypothetical protein
MQPLSLGGVDPARAIQEESVRELHDVRLVEHRHLAPTALPGVAKREARDPLAAGARRDLEALDDAGHDLVLQTGVEPLGVLPDHHQLHVLVAGSDPRHRAHRPHRGVEVEALAELHVHAGEAVADRRGQGPLERHPVLLDRRDRLLG